VSADKYTVSGAIIVTFAQAAVQSLLQHGFGFGKLHLCVMPRVIPDVRSLIPSAQIAGNGNGVSEIIFSFSIGIADAGEDGKSLLAGNRYKPSITGRSCALRP
jgi:hypothetical protein